MKKRTLAWIVAGISLVTLLLSSLAATGASAAADWSGSCAADRLCVYIEANGAGAVHTSGPEAPVQVYPTGWDNEVDSVHNNTQYWACVYENTYYGGKVQALRPGYRGNLVELTATDLNGQASSHKLAKSKAGCFTGFERCANGELCLFTEPGGRGEMTVSRTDDPEYGADRNNRVVSVANYTDRHACFYPEKDYTGTWNDDGRTYGKFVVLRSDSTVLPMPYTKSFSSHRLVLGTSLCTSGSAS
ncbi:peptidase inhibitor family I36 protein [Kitasatospora sp. NPDC002040]|uniref:peptidase inhibitor family I36 protein n=1 Tax=Kitasatospora sp. NPDC002040 TaxID=3154661 RepID=UPI00331D463D